MPHKDRKIRKKRGSRTHGWGRVGQHRKTGSRGGRNPGRHKALWSWVVRYEPHYFGKKGFHSHKSVKRKANVINVGLLDEIAEKLQAERKKGKLFIDLEDLGFTKLLGSGRITKPLAVKVASCSRSAVEKLERAGGQVVIETRKIGE
jgi:large subunit ribosomal protein L15